MGRQPVVEDKDATHRTIGNSRYGFANRQLQLTDDGEDNHDKSREETEGLEGVCKYQCADAATTGVKPDEQYHDDDGDSEWDAGFGKHELLQDDTDHIEPYSCPCHFRQQEETGTRQIRTFAKPLPQVGVDAGEVQLIIKR